MNAEDLEPFDLANLEKLRDRYEARHDSASAAIVREAISKRDVLQTEEESRSGRIRAVEMPRDAVGRVCTRFVGDWAAAFAPFMSGPIIGTINSDLHRGSANLAANLKKGE